MAGGGRYGGASGASAPGDALADAELEASILDELEDGAGDELDPMLEDAAMRAFPDFAEQPDRLAALVELIRGVALG